MLRRALIRLGLTLAAVAAFAGVAAAQGYELQPGDRIEISVLEDPALNRQAVVRPDGIVSMPLAGALQAEGRTPEQLQAAIRSALARDFIEPPTVTVSLLARGEPDEGPLVSVYVIGQVRVPGRYDFEPPIDALQALAVAGGLDAFAARERVQIRRREGGAETVYLFDYDRIEEGETPIDRLDLETGDVIVVPERGLFD